MLCNCFGVIMAPKCMVEFQGLKFTNESYMYRDRYFMDPIPAVPFLARQSPALGINYINSCILLPCRPPFHFSCTFGSCSFHMSMNLIKNKLSGMPGRAAILVNASYAHFASCSFLWGISPKAVLYGIGGGLDQAAEVGDLDEDKELCCPCTPGTNMATTQTYEYCTGHE